MVQKKSVENHHANLHGQLRVSGGCEGTASEPDKGNYVARTMDENSHTHTKGIKIVSAMFMLAGEKRNSE
jgi:hypothetical protein